MTCTGTKTAADKSLRLFKKKKIYFIDNFKNKLLHFYPPSC